MEKEKVLDIDICILDKNIFETNVINNIKKKQKTFIVAINPEKIMLVYKNTKLKNILNSATIQLPDGIGVILASKLKKGKIKHRLTGCDCMELLCEIANNHKYKVFLYGAKKEIVSELSKKLKEKYENINVCGFIDGYQQNVNNVIKKINDCKPDILFIALGSPNQELFIKENMEKINSTIFMGVGGSFDVLSGKTKRAPKIFQKIGLEWFYRLIKEPKRIFRQLKLFKFLYKAVFNKN